jgi:hypothetical protein
MDGYDKGPYFGNHANLQFSWIEIPPKDLLQKSCLAQHPVKDSTDRN